MPPKLKRQTLPELFLQAFPSIIPKDLDSSEAQEEFKKSIAKKVNVSKDADYTVPTFSLANLGIAQFTLESFQCACVKEAQAQKEIIHEKDPAGDELTAPVTGKGRGRAAAGAASDCAYR